MWGQWQLPGGSWALWLGEWISFPGVLAAPVARAAVVSRRPCAVAEVEAGRRARGRCCRGQHARLGFPRTGGLGREDASAWPRVARVDLVVRSCSPGDRRAALGAVAVVLSIVSVFVRYRAARRRPSGCSSSGCSSARSPPSRCCSARCRAPARRMGARALVARAAGRRGRRDPERRPVGHRPRREPFARLQRARRGRAWCVRRRRDHARRPLGRTTGAPLVATVIVAIG